MQSLIIIHRSEIPLYLHRSELYLSLDNDDDGEIFVPADCMKMNTDVSSESELEHLLLTMRYWILRYIPREVIQYIVDPPCTGILSAIFKPVNFEVIRLLEKFESTFRGVHKLVQCLHASPSYQAFNLSAQYGRIDFLSYYAQLKRPLTVYTLQIAAENGHVDSLAFCYRLLQKNKVSVDLNTLNWGAAVKNGHVSCLTFLMKHGVPASTLLELAIQNGSFKCIHYLHSHRHINCYVLSSMTAAAAAGNFELVQELHSQGCQWDQSAPMAALRADKPHILEFLLYHQPVLISEELVKYESKSVFCAFVIAHAMLR